MGTELAEVRDFQKLSSALETTGRIITKDYLLDLGKYKICDFPEELNELEISDYIGLFKLNKLVSDKKEGVLDKLVTVLNAAYSSNATVITLIKGTKVCVEYYLGVVSKDINQEQYNLDNQKGTFQGTLKGNFVGIDINDLKKSDIENLYNEIFSDGYVQNVSSVSGIASIRNEKENNFEKYVQGIENLTDSLKGKEYSILFIADPVKKDEIAIAKMGYENLYTQLSSFGQSTLSFNETDTITVSQSHTEGITESFGRSTSMTQNYSKTDGWSKTNGTGKSTTKDKGRMLGAVLGLGVTLATGGAAVPALAVASLAPSLGAGLIGAETKSENQSDSVSGNVTESSGKTNSKSENHGTSQSDMIGNSEAESKGRTLQFVNENKTVQNLLKKIDKHIERLQKCEGYGAFNCAAYVLSNDPEINAIAANGYNALMRGNASALQSSYINFWNDENEVAQIKKYLEKFSHPKFIQSESQNLIVTPASLQDSYETAVNLGIPKKSTAGIVIKECASFGRNLYMVSGKKLEDKISVGNIYHMGTDEQTEVELKIKDLSMHTFITGATGSGKSNAVYTLLDELQKKNVNFMVIEPAKGEYKHVFGNNGDVEVYGTNPKKNKLLRINPFSFPDDIHVLEHIDKLVEIFNVCWPMYAAMPAVLKEAVELAYKSIGWDLDESENINGFPIFPTFDDVLEMLEQVIQTSEFSEEVKSNYTGALLTRVRSLTNGINGRIFSATEIEAENLFDKNVIIDISRVGSMDTKSLIMGILVMKLQEHRVSEGGMNRELRHVTVLEEAHNLLKGNATSTTVSEGADLVGKSVEMLSNIIAEVRTYGEGFIIADQAPGLLDASVIRNTNTKIILRLPDYEDRKLVGKAANLSDEQIDELAKLPVGVAAVYHNDWLEPVLCHVKYYDIPDNLFENEMDTVIDSNRIEILKYLVDTNAGKENAEHSIESVERLISSARVSPYVKMSLLRQLETSEKINSQIVDRCIAQLFDSDQAFMVASKASTIDEWQQVLIENVDKNLATMELKYKNAVIHAILENRAMNDVYFEDMSLKWHNYITKRGVL